MVSIKIFLMHKHKIFCVLCLKVNQRKLAECFCYFFSFVVHLCYFVLRMFVAFKRVSSSNNEHYFDVLRNHKKNNNNNNKRFQNDYCYSFDLFNICCLCLFLDFVDWFENVMLTKGENCNESRAISFKLSNFDTCGFKDNTK